MFGGAGVQYGKVVVRGSGGGVGELRFGHFSVREYSGMVAAVVVAVVFLVVSSIALGVAVQSGEVDGSDPVSFQLIAGCSAFLVSVVTLLGMTLALNLCFQWRGTPSFGGVAVSYVCLTWALVLSLHYHLVEASVMMAVNGALSWACGSARWEGGKAGFRAFVGVVGLVMAVLCARVGSSVLPIFLWSALGVYRRSFVRRTFYGQSSVKVKNGSRVGLLDYEFARKAVPLSYEAVPFEVMAVVTRVPTESTTVEFRRWAMLGDAVLKLAVVQGGLESRCTVGEISAVEQRCLSRVSLAASVADVRMDERFGGMVSQDGSRVVGRASRAEMVEALVGVSWHYEYRRGSDPRWCVAVSELLVSRVGVPKKCALLGKEQGVVPGGAVG